ncbi:hypothetical protein H6P81_010603 [Aristolochia fimbriata]|uniref:Uncharacterized protein n=1 Tax=Aristolochia fimbriata TaxID=158543 RepID=A0AAV7EP86_ARIFI|nr:hypothetical protein H6P81_010603 [Aristolochia fimbriata]
MSAACLHELESQVSRTCNSLEHTTKLPSSNYKDEMYMVSVSLTLQQLLQIPGMNSGTSFMFAASSSGSTRNELWNEFYFAASSSGTRNELYSEFHVPAFSIVILVVYDHSINLEVVIESRL